MPKELLDKVLAAAQVQRRLTTGEYLAAAILASLHQSAGQTRNRRT